MQGAVWCMAIGAGLIAGAVADHYTRGLTPFVVFAGTALLVGGVGWAFTERRARREELP